MAAITATPLGVGAKEITLTTLTGTDDTFVYNKTARQVLVLRNPTVGTISPTIDGDGAATYMAPGVGEIDISNGFAVGAIGAGKSVAIRLDTISAYLAGDIAITGGADLVAALLSF